MNQVHRQLFFDAILAVGALVMTVILGASKCSQQHDPTAGELLLPRAATETCERLMLLRGLAEIRLSKQEGMGSWVTEQQQFPLGGAAAVEKLLAALREIRVIRHLGDNANPGELKRLGLDPPAFAWKMSGKKQSWVVKFGSSVPGPDSGAYVGVGRDASGAVEQIYAADTDLATLDITPEELIDPVLLRVRELDIADMTYESAQKSFHIRRDPHGIRWRESEAPGCRVDPEQASALLDELERLKPTPASGSATPGSDGVLSGVLKLRAATHEATLQFMGPCKVPGLTRTRVTRVGTAEHCVDTSALAELLKRGLTRDTRLFTLRVDEVESLKTNRGGDVEELRREGLGFVFEQQGPNLIDVEVGNGYLADLLGARGHFASGDQLPSEPSDYIRLRSSVIGTGDYEETLLLGPAMPDGSRLVRRVDDSAVLRIDKGTADLLRVGRHVLKQATRAPLDAGQSD